MLHFVTALYCDASYHIVLMPSVFLNLIVILKLDLHYVIHYILCNVSIPYAMLYVHMQRNKKIF